MALGSTLPSEIIGVNPRLLKYLIANRGQYFGVLMIDYFGTDLRLANATLGWEVRSGWVLIFEYTRSGYIADILIVQFGLHRT
jgi:hypothetical protein